MLLKDMLMDKLVRKEVFYLLLVFFWLLSLLVFMFLSFVNIILYLILKDEYVCLRGLVSIVIRIDGKN